MENTFPYKQANQEKATADSRLFQPTVGSAGGKLFTPGGHPIVPSEEQKAQGVIPLIPINYECEFLGNIYLERKQRQDKPNYFIYIQRLDKTSLTAQKKVATPLSGAPPQVQEFSNTSFAIVKMNNEDESINFGEHTLTFFPPPFSYPPSTKPMLGTISMTISDYKGLRKTPILLPNQPNPPPTSGTRRTFPPKPVVPGKMPPIEENKDDYDVEIFIDNKQVPAGSIFAPGDSIIFYLDSMRFIPENCGLVKVNLRAYSCNLGRVCEESVMLPILSSTVSMPLYQMKRVFATPTFNPTTLLVASLEVYDKVISRDRILGYIVVNAFIDSASKEPVKDVQSTNFKLNEGAFQLPIYCDNPLNAPFTMEKVYIISLN